MGNTERKTNIQTEKFVPTEGLTPEDDAKLAELLAKWKGGWISTPVFTELTKMVPQPIVEVVIFRQNQGKLETLLIPRPEDDIVWPGMWHNPGTSLRLSDFTREDQNPLNGAFERIKGGEVNNNFAYTPVLVERLFRTGDRGPEVAEIYFTELALGPDRENDVWYPVDKLAKNPKFIQGQLNHVLIAAEQFKNRGQ